MANATPVTSDKKKNAAPVAPVADAAPVVQDSTGPDAEYTKPSVGAPMIKLENHSAFRQDH